MQRVIAGKALAEYRAVAVDRVLREHPHLLIGRT
jgi:hypothetical protein